MNSIPAFEHPTVATWFKMVFFVAGWGTIVTCCLWIAQLHMERIEELNTKLPEGEKFAILEWNPLRRMEFQETYKRTFPGSATLRKEYKLIAIGIAGLALMAISLFGLLH
jgi:hypothetical protein